MLWRASDGKAPAEMHIAVLVLSIGTLPLVLLMTSKINTAVEEAEQRWKAEPPQR
jgi:hypothetical protein